MEILVTDLTAALAVLSAIITPAILISACGALTISTANRVSRVIDRTREIARLYKEVARTGESQAIIQEESAMLFTQVLRATRRSELLQQALASLYLAIGIFAATSISIGIVAFIGEAFAFIPIIIGFTGVGFLFYASVILIIDSRIGITAVFDEMEAILRESELGAREAERASKQERAS